MCTVSVVSVPTGFRLICNRDERIDRAAALAPRQRVTGGRSMLAPIDGARGGTWIGVNDAGIVAVLLNRTVPGARRGTTTRGEIVPRLLAAGTLEQCVRRARQIDPSAFDPFQVVTLHHRDVLIVANDGARVTVDVRALDALLVFTSSSLGDREAERRRMPLFARLVQRAPDPLLGQRAFHDHRWAECPAFSIRMSRHDARTVSRSFVDVRAGDVTFAYEPLVDWR